MKKLGKKKAKKIANNTIKILDKGGFFGEDDQWIDFQNELIDMIEKTEEYPTERFLPRQFNAAFITNTHVTQETTLEATRRIAGEGKRVVALNFASAKNPGGGFLNGAEAQEESLARASGLYYSIKDSGMYDYNRMQRGALYSDFAIYSPDVPFFKDDDGGLLEEVYLCSVVTCPAPNAGAIRRHNPKRAKHIPKFFRQRIRKVLSIMALNSHTHIVLGAWGCGVFRNAPEEIALIFLEVLRSHFYGVFEEVTFAIPDGTREQRFFGPFHELFLD